VIYRNYLGLDIQTSSLRAVSLRRRHSSYELTDGRVIGLAGGILAPGQRRDNLLNPEAFVQAVQDVLSPIASGEERIAVALPDSCGRLILLQVETPLPAGEESMDVVRWHLRDTLPADVPMQLDYQVLASDESGRQRLVVACVPKSIVRQYEDTLAAAGFGAERIVFRSLCQHNYFRRSFDAEEDFILVIADEGTLVFQACQGGTLVYHRARECTLTPESVFSELNRVISGEGARFGALRRATVYMHSAPGIQSELQPVLESLFDRPVRCLTSQLQALVAEGVTILPSQEQALVAAVGAAESLM